VSITAAQWSNLFAMSNMLWSAYLLLYDFLEFRNFDFGNSETFICCWVLTWCCERSDIYF